LRRDKEGMTQLIIGVTGSFGTGKTTVADAFRGLGAKVLDADRIAHAALARGSGAYTDIIKAFGRRILDSKGNIDRKKLSALAFKDSSLLKKLCGIIHPLVIGRIKGEIIKNKKYRAVVIDAPLLLEAGLGRMVDIVLVVKASRANQIKRCAAKFKMTRGEVLERIGNQMPLEKKVRQADFVIYNDGSKKETLKQALKIWRRLWI